MVTRHITYWISAMFSTLSSTLPGRSFLEILRLYDDVMKYHEDLDSLRGTQEL